MALISSWRPWPVRIYARTASPTIGVMTSSAISSLRMCCHNLLRGIQRKRRSSPQHCYKSMASTFQQMCLKQPFLQRRKHMSITLHELMKNQNVGVELVSHRPNAPGEHTDRDPIDALPPAHEQPSYGKVFLVGAGPGDPELITLKGLRSLRKADVVVYDRLICPDLLDEAPSQARRVFAGKASGHHSMKQKEINALLITYARRGCIVVRLKGGDPYVFGRGGEEALALAQAGVPFEVVPGVSSAIAVPAHAGSPVTHRDYASSVTIVTGHEGHGHAAPAVNWEALAQLGGTLVVLMGVKALPDFTRRLLEAGLTADLPAAVIQEGTTSRQQTVTGTLADIAERALAAGLSSPATTVIGNVVSLGQMLGCGEMVFEQGYLSET